MCVLCIFRYRYTHIHVLKNICMCIYVRRPIYIYIKVQGFFNCHMINYTYIYMHVYINIYDLHYINVYYVHYLNTYMYVCIYIYHVNKHILDMTALIC